MKYLSKLLGFTSTSHFLNSTFHPYWETVTFTAILTLIAGFVETFLGINIAVLICIMVLFSLEMYTGVKASINDNEPITSKRMPAGYVKLFIYLVMVAVIHILSKNLPQENLFGYMVDVYRLFHVAFINFIIANLIYSCLENFSRLGWDKKSKLIRLFNRILRIKEKP